MSVLRNIQRRNANEGVYRIHDDRYVEKSVLPRNTYGSILPRQLQLTFLRFHLQPGKAVS